MYAVNPKVNISICVSNKPHRHSCETYEITFFFFSGKAPELSPLGDHKGIPELPLNFAPLSTCSLYCPSGTRAHCTDQIASWQADMQPTYCYIICETGPFKILKTFFFPFLKHTSFSLTLKADLRLERTTLVFTL